MRSCFATFFFLASVFLIGPAHAAQMRVGDVTLHYVQAGPATAKTLVLIPGWSCASGVWRRQIDYFSKTMHVVAIDPRSQGESGKTADGNTPLQRARDYEAVFAALKLNDMVLVGWSQGVQDVASYIDQFGTKRLRGTVLVDASVSRGSAAVSANPKFVQTLLGGIDIYAKHKRDYLEGMMHAIFTVKMSDADFNSLVDTGMRTPTDTGIAELNADMLGADLTPALSRFDVPTLVVASAKSFELAEQKAEAAQLPHGSFVQIEQAGHGVFVDRPDAFNRALDTFIAALPG
ncbi:MAG TPA: alpha/beta hydrolase [Rhizomicrobium sp.]|nr:alpha/beta hydrolase [Rhizomicrobium sp.]